MKKRTCLIAICIGIAVIVALILLVAMQAQPQEHPQEAPQEEPQEEAQASQANNTIVVYFSRGENIVDASAYLETLGDDVDAMTSASVLMTDSGEITGNVGLLARWIAEEAGADLYSIQVEELYPQEKKETQNIVLQEQLDGVWPQVVPSTISFEAYDTVFLGFPNWYAEPPRALYSFLEENDLDGKTIIPFTSDDKNGFSDSVDILKSKLPHSAVLSAEDGLLVNRNDLFAAKEQTQEWVRTVSEKAAQAKNDPLGTSEGQKKAAEALIGQTLTSEEIVDLLGEYTKFSRGTNG